MGLALAAFMVYAPYLYYRCSLEHAKRLRPVVEGRVYRSGLMTSTGFRDAIQRHHIKTVINFMEEAPDPDLRGGRFNRSVTKESELCAYLGVDFKFVYLKTVAENRVGKDQPGGIDEFLKIMDDENAYPVLFHCKAGLHRTGAMAAVYRMEYQGWSPEDAMRELKSHGFGHYVANTTNELCLQYVLLYKPRGSAAEPAPVTGTLTSRQK
jgi:tyrosine-protein phosphatase SIW14